MSATPNPMPPSLPQTPSLTPTTILITGLQVDIYGLPQLPPSATSITCLWLHHARTRSRADMADIASRAITAYNSAHPASTSPTRGLIALAWDQRNHGSRVVPGEEKVNGAWREGNERHAQDMFGVIAGMVADQRGLMDALGGYLFHDEAAGRRRIDGHLCLGISLGGHSVWQTLFAEERMRAGVVVIGCPDFEYLLRDRARLSKLQTYSHHDNGASFTHSKDFPPALVEWVKKLDPKGILFGTDTVPAPGTTSPAEQKRLRAILDEKVRGKKILVTSGGDDKLVPYKCSKPFLDWFKDAIGTWYADGGVVVEDNVYPGVGHTFSAEMVKDAVRFIVDVVESWDKEELVASKI